MQPWHHDNTFVVLICVLVVPVACCRVKSLLLDIAISYKWLVLWSERFLLSFVHCYVATAMDFLVHLYVLIQTLPGPTPRRNANRPYWSWQNMQKLVRFPRLLQGEATRQLKGAQQRSSEHEAWSSYCGQWTHWLFVGVVRRRKSRHSVNHAKSCSIPHLWSHQLCRHTRDRKKPCVWMQFRWRWSLNSVLEGKDEVGNH